MKKMLLLAALMLAAVQVWAGNVDLLTAQSKASAFLSGKATKGRLMTSAPTIKWTHEVKNSSNASKAAFYVVNTDRGYVIVAGDDRARDILAYGAGNLENLNDLPEAMKLFLNKYQKQMEYLQAHPELVVEKSIYRGGVSVEPLLHTAWAQGKPYNMYCPKVGRDYCKVGCSAISLAQVMRYWEYPASSPALPGYTGEEFGVTVPALPEYTFDWDNMWDTYENYTTESAIDRIPEANKNAITYFLRYVGQAETMDYGTNMSGADYPEIMQAIHTFGYDEGVHIEMKWDYDDGTVNYTEEEWGELIQSELLAGRPLVYCAFDTSGEGENMTLAGHAFNVDGYDAENDMYHVNFGMSSALNAYYALDAFQIDYVTVYDFFPLLFAGLQPPGLVTNPRILVDKMNVNMACYVDETITDTITVKGQNLTEGIAVALNDENGVFTIDVNSIALDQAGNAHIVVTYAPNAVGTHNATITLTSEGADDKVITLSGTATNVPLEKYAPVMLPAVEDYINLTSFRADWTDQTPAQNVLSYTLDVNFVPVYNTLASADWSGVGQNYNNVYSSASEYFPEGWVFTGNGLWLEGGYISINASSNFCTPTWNEDINKVTVVIYANNNGYGASKFTVSTSVASQEITPGSSTTQYVVVLDCAASDKVTITGKGGYPGFASIQVYPGEVAAPQMRAVVTGDASHYVITGITDKFYTVTDLNAEGTYRYKVKAIYVDNTESEWSNTEEVTLFANTPAYDNGDVNHDGFVDVDDVTTLISYVLNGTSEGFYIDTANVNGEEGIDVSDVTALISLVLGN